MSCYGLLSNEEIKKISEDFGTPTYVYFENKLEEFAESFKKLKYDFGLNVRYAMKANSNMNILKMFNNLGFFIDASSEYEVDRALNAGIHGYKIQLCSQQLPNNLGLMKSAGVFFVATSLHQLETYGKMFPGSEVGIRINPGHGHGAFTKISTGGFCSSFGIWFEKINDIHKITTDCNLKITKIHLHVGSENSPESWLDTIVEGLKFVDHFIDVDCLNIGGGYKMAIMHYEHSADIEGISELLNEKLKSYYLDTGRKIKLEMEPGKYLVINSCSLITKVVDIVDTGENGYKFLKVDTGMTELPRVTMYGIQQPINIINDSSDIEKYVISGHCCESGDILTCKLYESETVEELSLQTANIGDILVIDGVGAYSSSMSMKNYNSYPEAGEVLVMKNSEIKQIRKPETVEQIRRNEIDVIR